MIKRTAIVLGASCVLALIACDKQDIDPATDSKELRTRELPAAVSVREREARGQAVEARAERVDHEPSAATGRDYVEPSDRANVNANAKVAVKADDNVNVNVGPARRAEADLSTVGDAKLDALATFEEKQDGVEVRVRVEGGKPGTRSVRIYDRANCDDLEKEPLGEPFASSNKQGALGSVTIGPSGKGTLETKAFNSTLKPNDSASLLGKTIVVQERAAGSPKASGDPIACGVIEADQGLADKAGRMQAP